MKKVEIPKKWLGMMIGLCIFSLAAAVIEYQRVKPTGFILDSSSALSSSDPAAVSAMPAQAETADNVQLNSSGSSASPGTATGLNNSQATREPDLVPVYLVGAVNQPGIYQIVRGSYLYQLIDQAGGLRPDAAATEINLAQKITENIHIRIPTTGEFAEHPAYAWTDSVSESTSTIVNLNLATIDELDTLPGIGPATAKAIVDYRERNGPFTAKEDLMKVAGIKQSRYDVIADLIDIR